MNFKDFVSEYQEEIKQLKKYGLFSEIELKVLNKVKGEFKNEDRGIQG